MRTQRDDIYALQEGQVIVTISPQDPPLFGTENNVARDNKL